MVVVTSNSDSLDSSSFILLFALYNSCSKLLIEVTNFSCCSVVSVVAWLAAAYCSVTSFIASYNTTICCSNWAIDKLLYAFSNSFICSSQRLADSAASSWALATLSTSSAQSPRPSNPNDNDSTILSNAYIKLNIPSFVLLIATIKWYMASNGTNILNTLVASLPTVPSIRTNGVI